MNPTPAIAGPRERVRALVESEPFNRAIIAVIVVNAITLGLETSPRVTAQWGGALHLLDQAALWIFVAELLLRFYAFGLGFFRDAWRVFDFVVVGISLLPSSGAFTVLRALRVLRVLRLVSMVPSMRRVVGALLAALPGMGSIAALLLLVMYVGAVMATRLFGQHAPDLFGDMGASFFTLFQVMTIEGWPDIARRLMEVAPWAWVFFVVYILVCTFMVLNLFIAVVVNAMQEQVAEDLKSSEQELADAAHLERKEMMEELRALRRDVAALREGSRA